MQKWYFDVSMQVYLGWLSQKGKLPAMITVENSVGVRLPKVL